MGNASSSKNVDLDQKMSTPGLSEALLSAGNSSNVSKKLSFSDVATDLNGDGECLVSKERNISKISAASLVDYLIVPPSNSAALTTFLLLNTMIGSGILNQPYVFMESGIVGGLLGFIVASLMTWAGLIILNESGVKMNVLDYSGVADAIFGKKGQLAIDYSIIINGFGSQLGYVIVVGETISGLIVSWGCNSFMCTETSVIIISVILFVAPVCLLRHFGHFAWLSVFSITAIILVMFLVIIGGPLKQHHGEIKTFDALGICINFSSS